MVDVGLRHVASYTEHRQKRLHPLEQDVVVVAAEGIGGDATTRAAPTEQSARQLVQAYLPVVRRTLQAIPDAPKRVSVVVTTGPLAHA
jgi:hypothetical protein